jgi:hypothetical protein
VAAVQGVPVRVGMPGVTAVVAAGAVVLLGWEKGDPSRPYAAPAWEPGASVTKLVINGTVVYLGAEAGAQFVALANLVKNELDKIQTTIESFSPATGDGWKTAAASRPPTPRAQSPPRRRRRSKWPPPPASAPWRCSTCPTPASSARATTSRPTASRRAS